MNRQSPLHLSHRAEEEEAATDRPDVTKAMIKGRATVMAQVTATRGNRGDSPAVVVATTPKTRMTRVTGEAAQRMITVVMAVDLVMMAAPSGLAIMITDVVVLSSTIA